MWVAEAAGYEECREGYPLVRDAVAGSLFTRLLWENGINRNQLMIANTFRYRPTKNQVDLFFAPKRAGAEAALDYPPFRSQYVLQVHLPEIKHLERAIRLIRPSLIVALGAVPLWALTGKNTITRERGRVHEMRPIPGEDQPIAPIPVLATFHPSYIARQISLGDREPERAFVHDIGMTGPLRDLELQQGCPRELDWAILDDPLTHTPGHADRGGLLSFLDNIEQQRPAPANAA